MLFQTSSTLWTYLSRLNRQVRFLIKRLITAFITIPIFLAMIYYEGLFLQVGLAIMVVIGLYEFSRFYQNQVYWDYLLLAGLSLLALAYTGLYDSFLVLWFAIQLIYYLIRATFTDYKPLEQIWQMAAVFYVAGLFSFIWLLRTDFGFKWVIFGVFITWITDSTAYFTGLKYGKTQLAPKISPKKTIEGSIGGLIGATAVGLVFAVIYSYSIIAVVLLSVALSVIGQMGDLVESAIKRERGVKDSGRILPGHGGILDRFDSMLFVLPSLYFLLRIFIV